MAVREYKCALPWAQLGNFQVGLCIHLHLKDSKESGVRHV